MKTKFLINSEIFYYGDLEKCFDIYEECYKEYGYILDKENQDVYIIFDEQFDFKEGDRITISGITRLVDWKNTDISKRMIIYSLDEE